MTDNKKIHLSVWTAWLVLHGYLLCFRFSLSNLVVLGLAAGILLLTTYSSGKYEDGHLVHTLGNVIGASLFVQLAWHFAENILPRLMGGDGWFENVSQTGVTQLMELLQHMLSGDRMSMPIFLSLVLFGVRLFSGKRPRLQLLASYAGSAVLMVPMLKRLYESHVISMLYIAVLLVFLWADLWHLAVEEEWNRCGKRWINVLSLLLLYTLSWNRFALVPLTAPGALETIFVLKATSWYHLLAAGVVIGGLIAAYIHVDPHENVLRLDMRLLAAVGTMLLLTAFLKWFYVGWWWMLVLVQVLYLLAEPLVLYPNLDSDQRITESGVQLGIGVGAIALAVTGHFGTWPMLLAFCGAALVVFFGMTLLLDWDKEALYLPGGVLTAVLAILIPALTWLWVYRRLAYSFWLLLILAAVFTVIAWLLCWNVNRRDRKNVLAPIAAAIAFAVLALNLTMTGGSRIDVELNERGIPVVTAEARGEENQIVSTEYRWAEDWLDLEAGTFTVSEEEPVRYLTPLAGREGKLRVITTDSYGIVTETIFWIHHLPQIDNG